jgi:hypothetical protein
VQFSNTENLLSFLRSCQNQFPCHEQFYQKRVFAKIYWGEDNVIVLASKIDKVKCQNRITKIVQSILKIRVHTTYLLYSRLGLKATEAYVTVFTAKYKLKPPILIVKEVALR